MEFCELSKQSENVKKKKKELEIEEPIDNINPFFCHKDKIKLKKGEILLLPIIFSPFKFTNYNLKLIFLNVKVGEFQHEIFGETLMPDPFLEVIPNQNLYVDISETLHFSIPIKNEQYFHARKVYENRLITSGRTKERNKFRETNIVQDLVAFDVNLGYFFFIKYYLIK